MWLSICTAQDISCPSVSTHVAPGSRNDLPRFMVTRFAPKSFSLGRRQCPGASCTHSLGSARLLRSSRSYTVSQPRTPTPAHTHTCGELLHEHFVALLLLFDLGFLRLLLGLGGLLRFFFLVGWMGGWAAGSERPVMVSSMSTSWRPARPLDSRRSAYLDAPRA